MMSLYPINSGFPSGFPGPSSLANQPYNAPRSSFDPTGITPTAAPNLGGVPPMPLPFGAPTLPTGDTFSRSNLTEMEPSKTASSNTDPAKPDLMLNDFSELTPQNVRSKGDVRGMVFDMDDTLSRFKLGERGIPPELLAQLKNLQDSGIKLGVVTNNPSDETAKRLQRQLIDADIHMEVITNAAKPHTQGLEMMREKFGLPANQMMMVGDQPSDVQTGKSAGFKTAQVDWFRCSDLRKTLMHDADKVWAHVCDVKNKFDPTPDKPEFLPPVAETSPGTAAPAA
jgi:HAD superfamily phosphatase (TIGR01668 family)